MSDTATTEAPEATTEPTAPETPPTATPADDLGDAGKKALAAERKARRDAEKAVSDLAARVKEFEDASKSEAEKAAARAEAAEKALADMTTKALRLEVVTETGLPADLAEFLTGTDAESLRAQAEKLKAATALSKAPRAPQPDPSQGAKPDAAGPSQLTRADMARMNPEQIETARIAGRFDDLLAGKQT